MGVSGCLGFLKALGQVYSEEACFYWQLVSLGMLVAWSCSNVASESRSYARIQCQIRQVGYLCAIQVHDGAF
jgi:hypothetical protein